MNTIHMGRESAQKVLWVAAPAILALACTCPLFTAITPAVPTPTTYPSVYPTYTLYPTYTSLPISPSATQPINLPATQKPPAPNPTATFTKQPPTKTPTATLTEQPPPPGGGSWGVTTADLAVTDLFPDNWPQGRIYVRITNNGPDSLSNIPNNQLSCTAGIHPYSGSPPYASGSGALITISLVPGQTEAYDTGITVDGTINWYVVTCGIQANFKDPSPSNDSYSETFPPPP